MYAQELSTLVVFIFATTSSLKESHWALSRSFELGGACSSCVHLLTILQTITSNSTGSVWWCALSKFSLGQTHGVRWQFVCSTGTVPTTVTQACTERPGQARVLHAKLVTPMCARA